MNALALGAAIGRVKGLARYLAALRQVVEEVAILHIGVASEPVFGLQPSRVAARDLSDSIGGGVRVLVRRYEAREGTRHGLRDQLVAQAGGVRRATLLRHPVEEGARV